MKHKFRYGIRLAALALVIVLAVIAALHQEHEDVLAVTDTTAQPTVRPTILTLGYTPGDGFNPYVANSTLVLQNAGLLFEQLVQITPDMDLDYRLAQSIDTTDTQVIITLRGGCSFADGAPVTVEDLAACFAAAQASTVYGGRFSGVSEMEVVENSLVLTLSSPDSLFAYLCDLPIMKASEVAASQPTASGRYTYGENNTLVKNSRAAFPETGPSVIDLTAVSSYDEMVSGLAVGALNLYAAAGDGDSAGINGKENYYKTNNLIYLGMNSTSEKPLLDTAAGRSLLSGLLDRRQLAEKSYYSRAYPATGAINSFYPCVNSQQVILSEQVTEGSADVLEGLGYRKNDDRLWCETNDDGELGAPLSLNLLVYGGNTYKRYAASLVADQLSGQGISVQMNTADDFESYKQAVLSGEFELYIGEVKLYNNMDLSPFLSGGNLSAGLAQSAELNAAYAAFRANKSAAGQFEQTFAAQMPFAPLLWRNGTVVSGSSVSGLTSSISNIFYSVAGLSVASGS